MRSSTKKYVFIVFYIFFSLLIVRAEAGSLAIIHQKSWFASPWLPGVSLILTSIIAGLIWQQIRLYTLSRQLKFFQRAATAAPYQWALWDSQKDELLYADAHHILFNIHQEQPHSLTILLNHLINLDQSEARRRLHELVQKKIPFSLLFTHQNTTYVWIGAPTDHPHFFLFSFHDAETESDQQKIYSVLSQENTKLTNILDALPFPIWHFSPALRLDYCNTAYAQAVETSPEIAIQENREILIGGMAGYENTMAQKAAESDALQTAYYHAIVQQQRYYFQFFAAPSSQGITGCALNMNELEKVRTDLDRHTIAYRDVLERLSTSIAVFGSDTRLVFFNPSYIKLFDHDEQWLHNHPTFGEILESLRLRRRLPEHADFPAYKRKQLQMFTNLTESYEENQHLPNGTTLRTVITPYPQGGLLILYEDATKDLALERKYHTLMAVQRVTLDHLSEGVVVFGIDNQLKLSNPAFLEMWQLTPEQCISGRHLSQVFGDLRNFFDEGDWQNFKTMIIEDITDRTTRAQLIHRNDGKTLEYSYHPLPDGSHLLRYLDVTARERIAASLQESREALIKIENLKSAFIKNISHELRSPLSVIIGYSEYLTKPEYLGKLNKGQAEYVEGIWESARQLLTLINNILDTTHLEAGYVQLNMEKFSLNGLLDEALHLVRNRAYRKGVELCSDYSAALGEMTGDKQRLLQSLFALLANAVEFTPEHGTITLSAKHLEKEIIFTVRDTGPGIPLAAQKRFLKKTDAELKVSDHPIGLGLSLAKRLVELHKGRMTIESGNGIGTTISCYVPVKPMLDVYKNYTQNE